MDYKKQFKDLLEDIARETYTQPYQIMEDWAELTATGLSIPGGLNQQRKRRYLELAKKYNNNFQKMSDLLDKILVPALEADPEQDFLGEIYCEPWSNRKNGEVFTPYHVAKAMAKMTLSNAQELIDKNHYITICEPACGAGVMTIAAINVLREMGITSPLEVYTVGTDIKQTYCHFSYIQWSLLGMTAEVQLGNSLTGEISDRWITPILARDLLLWNMRFALKTAEHSKKEQKPSIALKTQETEHSKKEQKPSIALKTQETEHSKKEQKPSIDPTDESTYPVQLSLF